MAVTQRWKYLKTFFEWSWFKAINVLNNPQVSKPRYTDVFKGAFNTRSKLSKFRPSFCLCVFFCLRFGALSYLLLVLYVFVVGRSQWLWVKAIQDRSCLQNLCKLIRENGFWCFCVAFAMTLSESQACSWSPSLSELTFNHNAKSLVSLSRLRSLFRDWSLRSQRQVVLYTLVLLKLFVCWVYVVFDVFSQWLWFTWLFPFASDEIPPQLLSLSSQAPIID